MDLFHYGVTGGRMYALMGRPRVLRLPEEPAPGGPVGALPGLRQADLRCPRDAVDIAAVVGTIIGSPRAGHRGGRSSTSGSTCSSTCPWAGAQISLVALGITAAAVSAFTGVDRGIRVLSMLNLYVALGLAFYVLVTGGRRSCSTPSC